MHTPKDFWERCPVCRARLKDAVECPRCEMDFRAVLSVAEQEGRLSSAVLGKLRAGEHERALWMALRAARLHSTPRALKMLALAALANKHYDLALDIWKRLDSISGGEDSSEL